MRIGKRYLGVGLAIRMTIFCALLTAFVLFLISCFQVIPQNAAKPAFAQNTTNQFLTYQNATFGITMKYPASWAKEDLDPSAGGIEHFSAPKVNANDAYVENLEVHYVDLPKGTTLQDYSKILLQSYPTNIENFTILQANNSSSLALSPAYLVIFTGYYNAFNYQALNTWTIIGNRALVIIYYAEPDRYLTYLPQVNDMIKSIEVDPMVFGKATPSGIYRIPTLGIDVEFPPYWSIIDSGKSNSTLFKGAPTPFGIENATDRVLMFGLTGQLADISTRYVQNSDPDLNCGFMHTASIIRIKEKKALETELNCNDGMVLKKVKSYIFGTSEGKIILIGYGAASDSSYDKYLADFDTSIQDLKLTNAIDLSDINYYANLTGLVKDKKQFVANGIARTIDFASNPRITDFKLDGNTSSVSFNADGQNRTGEAFLRISDLLQGPFIVNVDGKTSNNGVFVINDQTIPETYLDIRYDHNKHKIVIVGTNVAPEFTLLYAAPLFAAGIAVSIFILRRNSFSGSSCQL